MNKYLFLAAVFLLLASCGGDKPLFQVTPPDNADLFAKSQEYVPRLIKACPGLDQYSEDFTPATIEPSSMDGYEGGILVRFQIAQRPAALPDPLNLRCGGHVCEIVISADGSKAYIAKRACHSICDGKWRENDEGLMGREIWLK